jgi:AbrB family looped-hinge helix DNA binding protein
MATAPVMRKGRITLPKVVRARLVVDTGDRVEFIVKEQGDVVLPRSEDLCGFLNRRGKRSIHVEAINRAILREHSRKR